MTEEARLRYEFAQSLEVERAERRSMRAMPSPKLVTRWRDARFVRLAAWHELMRFLASTRTLGQRWPDANTLRPKWGGALRASLWAPFEAG